jgi:hypothetical protein
MISILHIGNGNEKHLGARFYGVERKLQNGLIKAGHNSLFFSDRDVKRTSGLFGTNWRGLENCNKKLLSVVRNFCPEMILLGHANIITNQTLLQIRELIPNIKIAQYNVDALFRVENVQAIENRIPYIDSTFLTTAGAEAKKYGKYVYYIPNPIDPAIETHKCFEADNEYDVFFACRAASTKGAHDTTDRLIIPKFLQQNASELRYNFHGFDGKPELFGAEFYAELSKCAMGLNISQKQTTRGELQYATPAQKYLYSSDRIAQYLGCGLLVFCETGFGLEKIFTPDEMMIYFSDKQELAEKLKFYSKNHELRRQIAKAGWQYAHTHFNNQLIASFIVEATMQQPFSHDYEWLKF